jgi:glycosyltransferase involved in cell wall biosynthesis
MPTLLSINNYHYVRGGAEFVFLAHNDILADTGWDVIPFCMKHERNLPSEWEDYFVEEIELGEDYGFAEKLSKSFKAIYSREAQKKLLRLIQTVQPDLAHGHNIYHHLSPSILSTLAGNGVPTVLTLHDLKLACPAYRMITHDGICERCKGGAVYNAARHRCMHGSAMLSIWVTAEAYVHRFLRSYDKYVDRFIVPSRFYIRKFEEWGWSGDRFEYIPNFVDGAGIRPDFRPGDYFAYFGRLSGEKGLATLLSAAARADVSLQIIGTGPEERNLRSMASQLGVEVDFPGYVSGDALFDRLRGARAIVLPSEWYENAPISLLEAYAAGKPVIGADIGGIPELITEQRGRTFKAFSIDSLAGALTAFEEMPDSELEQLGQNARSYVLDVHSRHSYLDKCQSLYKALV